MIRRYAMELLVITLLMVVCGVVLSMGYARYAKGHNPSALREAREWALRNGLSVETVVCANEDASLDGYVMCVVMTKERTLVSLDCPLGLWGKTGCRTW